MAFFENTDNWSPEIAARAHRILDEKVEEYAQALAALNSAPNDKNSEASTSSMTPGDTPTLKSAFQRATLSVTNKIKKVLSSAQEEIKMYIATTPGCGTVEIVDILLWWKVCVALLEQDVTG
jgi:hypothetical protein